MELSSNHEMAAAGDWFADITDAAGINFVHDPGAHGKYLMPEHIGSGCALFDFNCDGRLDIMLIQNAGPDSPKRHQLYRQETSGKFTDVSEGSGLNVAAFGMGVAIGDVNNDGWPDVLLTEYGGIRLFMNRAGQHFEDVSTEYELVNPKWAASAAFFDYDRDGWLDLVVANYIDYDPTHQCYDESGAMDYCSPEGAPPTVTRLFHNLGGVKFEDATVSSGLVQAPGPGLGVVCADFNADRWPDIFIADDEKPNRLFINQRDGTFTEEAAVRGVAFNALGQVAADMGIGLGDVDGDLVFDLFVTHLDQEFHNLWQQGPRGVFQDRTAEVGLTQSAWRGTGFGTVMADFDLDGALDLALVNGRIKRDRYADSTGTDDFGLPAPWPAYAQRSQLFHNDGRGVFRDVSLSNGAFCGVPIVGRGLACGDIDNDGDIDLLAVGIAGPARLYRNVAKRLGHWLTVRATDPEHGGRDAHGALLTVHCGNRAFWGMVNPAQSYLSSHDPRVHFGLGTATRFDRIHVVWPDGKEEWFPGGETDRFVLLERGEDR